VIESNSISSSILAGIGADWLQQGINIFLSIADQLQLIFSTKSYLITPPFAQYVEGHFPRVRQYLVI